MESVKRMVAGCIVVFGCSVSVHQTGASPWRSSADQLPALPQDIDMELVVDREKIETYEPLIARITLSNRGDEPFALKVRQDGAPRSVASLVARGNESFFRHHQWLRTSGPSSREISLAPGESTTGEILILLGGPPTGFPFAEAGRYSVKFGCQPDQHFAPVYTNEVRISVIRDDRGNAPFLDELSEIVYSRYGWDRESVIRGNGEDYIPGIEILKRVIKVRKPHLVDPDRNPADKREAEFVDLLTDLLNHHPDTSYSGYIARFLGLVHMKTFEHEISHRGAGSWGETKKSPNHDAVRRIGQSAYEKALRYLTVADKADLWPRTTAMRQLGRLHIMAEEWEKAIACFETLRTKHAEIGGAGLADELQEGMNKYRAKLKHQQERESMRPDASSDREEE